MDDKLTTSNDRRRVHLTEKERGKDQATTQEDEEDERAMKSELGNAACEDCVFQSRYKTGEHLEYSAAERMYLKRGGWTRDASVLGRALTKEEEKDLKACRRRAMKIRAAEKSRVKKRKHKTCISSSLQDEMDRNATLAARKSSLEREIRAIMLFAQEKNTALQSVGSQQPAFDDTVLEASQDDACASSPLALSAKSQSSGDFTDHLLAEACADGNDTALISRFSDGIALPTTEADNNLFDRLFHSNSNLPYLAVPPCQSQDFRQELATTTSLEHLPQPLIDEQDKKAEGRRAGVLPQMPSSSFLQQLPPATPLLLSDHIEQINSSPALPCTSLVVPMTSMHRAATEE